MPLIQVHKELFEFFGDIKSIREIPATVQFKKLVKEFKKHEKANIVAYFIEHIDRHGYSYLWVLSDNGTLTAFKVENGKLVPEIVRSIFSATTGNYYLEK